MLRARELAMLTGVTTSAKIDPDGPEDLLHKWSAKDMFGTQVIYFGIPQFFPSPILTVNEQAELQHPEKGIVTRCSELSEKRVWVTYHMYRDINERWWKYRTVEKRINEH